MRNLKINATALLTAGVFFAFLTFGFADNLKGPTLPELLDDLNFNYSLGGTLLFGAYVGFLLATLFNGFLSDLAGKKAPLIVAGASLTAGLLGYSYFRSFGWLLAAMVCIGLGLGSIELGANSIIVDLHSTRKGRFLNLMAVFHGAGSMLAPIYAGQLLENNFTWQQVYRFAVILPILMLGFFLMVKYPHRDTAPIRSVNLHAIRKSAFTRQMIWFYLVIGLYVAFELGIASWIVEFLQKTKSQSIGASTQALSIFFGLMTVGRFIGSFFVERVGYLRSVLISSITSAVCVGLGIFGPDWLAFGVPLSGFFMAIIFPTVTAAASDLHNQNVGSVLGLLFTFAGVGGMLGPWLVGLASDALGIYLGFGTVLVYCILMTGAIAVLMKITTLKEFPKARTPLEV
jgi:FHS family glucose/mannose:H+ symporter-like MFS transporter